VVAERDDEARRKILAHHEELLEGVRDRVAAVIGATAAGELYDAARAELVAYLAGEVLPHAAAEETTIYLASSGVGLGEKVEAMVAEHRVLEGQVEALAAAADPATCSRVSAELSELFARHVAVENDVLLPALLGSGDVSLADVRGEMGRAFSRAKAGIDGSPSSQGAEPVLLPALADALVALARAGAAEEACRLAAATWAKVRRDQPQVAVRLTALLHRLVRLEEQGSPGPAMAPRGDQVEDPDLDVRQLAPAQRHQVIFTAYAALRPAAGFVLVNDHDPKPLRYQFAAEHPGEFSWDYLEAGPKVWRVRIGRTSTPAVA
jgi:uncharacterized protein (DUF2249 family)